jgi:hypothetical protein
MISATRETHLRQKSGKARINGFPRLYYPVSYFFFLFITTTPAIQAAAATAATTTITVLVEDVPLFAESAVAVGSDDSAKSGRLNST